MLRAKITRKCLQYLSWSYSKYSMINCKELESQPTKSPTINSLDLLFDDIAEGDLEDKISIRLKKKHFDFCTEGSSEYDKVYSGKIIGERHRHFVSIPTSLKDKSNYIWVHYLVSTGSHFSTLNHRTICALHEQPYSIDFKFADGDEYSVGGKLLEPRCFDSHLNSKHFSNQYKNVNVLGMDFLLKFDNYHLKTRRLENSFDLVLIGKNRKILTR